MTRHWLMKSEPEVYSIHDLERDGTTHWDGVRNYQARNFMQDMAEGDRVLFYHSNAKPPGVAGLARVHKEAYPDHTAWAPGKYHDPKSDPDAPRWFMVDLVHEKTFADLVSLDQIKAEPRFDGMPLVQRGQRLSVQPVDPEHFEAIMAMADA